MRVRRSLLAITGAAALAAVSLALVAAAPSSSPAVTDHCGSEVVEEDDGAVAVNRDGGAIPHLDICAVHADPTPSGIDLAVVVAGDTADRAPSDHWLVNFTLEGCGYGVHTFHDALTDSLNPPTTQLTRFCGDGGTVDLADSILEGRTVSTLVTAADIEAVGGIAPEDWTVTDVSGRTWLGASSQQGPDAVYTWDSTASDSSTVSGQLPPT